MHKQRNKRDLGLNSCDKTHSDCTKAKSFAKKVSS